MPISHSIEIAVPPAKVYAIYADVHGWPTWDKELTEISVPGGLKNGSTGWLKPKGGPKSTVTISDVVEGQSFKVTCKLPLSQMVFTHLLTPTAGGTKVDNGLHFTGPLAFLFRLLIGGSVNKSMPGTLQGLKQFAEAKR
jgi:hypothetical protein